MYRFICDICGRQLDAEEEDEVVELTQRHLQVDHGMDDSQDTKEPNLLQEEDKIRERIEELEG